MNDIKIAIIGSGSMARRRAGAFSKLSGCRVAGVAARNRETGSQLADELECSLFEDWRALVDSKEIDGITISTHNQIHGEIALSALKRGKHVFCEYPAARYLEEISNLRALIAGRCPVFRVAHNEQISRRHKKLKGMVNECGELTIAQFTRLTAGRGARPEVLFNLNLSGPPALFFVYHVYPMIDLFGPVAWVESQGIYEGLEKSGQYRCFLNTLQVEFRSGGYGHWTWAGGIEIARPWEAQQIVMSAATLRREKSHQWLLSSANGDQLIELEGVDDQTLEEQFLNELTEGSKLWKEDAERALHAAEIGILAEDAAAMDERIQIAR